MFSSENVACFFFLVILLRDKKCWKQKFIVELTRTKGNFNRSSLSPPPSPPLSRISRRIQNYNRCKSYDNDGWQSFDNILRQSNSHWKTAFVLSFAHNLNLAIAASVQDIKYVEGKWCVFQCLEKKEKKKSKIYRDKNTQSLIQFNKNFDVIFFDGMNQL